jgi:hypothetical protein
MRCTTGDYHGDVDTLHHDASFDISAVCASDSLVARLNSRNFYDIPSAVNIAFLRSQTVQFSATLRCLVSVSSLKPPLPVTVRRQN